MKLTSTTSGAHADARYTALGSGSVASPTRNKHFACEALNADVIYDGINNGVYCCWFAFLLF